MRDEPVRNAVYIRTIIYTDEEGYTFSYSGKVRLSNFTNNWVSFDIIDPFPFWDSYGNSTATFSTNRQNFPVGDTEGLAEATPGSVTIQFITYTPCL